MKRTATMVSLVEDYLAVRRQLGFALEIAGEQLLAFARFADKSGHRGPVTFDLAVRWAQASPCPTTLTSARRFEVLRPFLTYRSQRHSGTARNDSRGVCCRRSAALPTQHSQPQRVPD